MNFDYSDEQQQLADSLRTRFGERVNLLAAPAIHAAALKVFDQTFVVTELLKLLILGIAFVGIGSAFMVLGLARRGELQTLQSLGIGPRHCRRLLVWQGAGLGLLTALLALPVGYGLAWVLIEVVNPRAFGWRLAFEAARAGTVANARPAAMRAAFERAMTGYHGGGTTTAELAISRAKALAEAPFTRIEILSPTKESFDDYHSPALAARMGGSGRVIPNTNLAHLACPIDRPGCRSNPGANASGQTLHDANLLKLRITYGIPAQKQIPLAGPFMARALAALDPADGDAFRAGLITGGRIPVVAHTVMRMQSPAIEVGNPSSPGPGNAGRPVDPGPPPQGPGLPECPVTDPACTPPTEPPPAPEPVPGGCDPLTDPGCGSPPSCQAPADWLKGISTTPTTP